jgi:large subunit ribosomal protein L7/L12
MSQRGGPRRYEPPAGHHIVCCYPVEGETFVELWFGDAIWGQLTIVGVHHDRRGDARVADATFVLSLYPPVSEADGGPWEFDLNDVYARLEEARRWLLDNERGVEPLAQDGLAPAGKAFSKISAADRDSLWAVEPASNPAPPDFGIGGLELVLINPGSTPIQLIRTIREITGFGLMDSRVLLDTCPSVVITGLSEDRAVELRRALESAGAAAEIRHR